MSAIDQVVIDTIAHGVLDAIRPALKQQAKVVNEDDLMSILGVKAKATMAEYRKRGLVGHRIDFKHWVYFWDDVENFIRSEGMQW